MKQAAKVLVGLHDFGGFCKPRPGATTIRRLRSIKISRNQSKGRIIEIEVKGDAKSLATFRQRREGLANEFMQGIGKNVNYNGKEEVLILLGDASMKRLLNMQMRDQLRGGKIEYRDDTQEYRVSPPANQPKGAPPSTRAILAPRSKVLIQ
jgi:lipopolysaccharide transport protein LptA